MYCSKCGSELREGALFCPACGAAAQKEGVTSRQEVWDGAIHKCPLCGEVLPSFTATCPACGYELRESAAASSVRAFAERLMGARDARERAIAIAAFPVPNTKEDITEFLILTAANITRCDDDEEYEAWRVKFEQCSSKARLISGGQVQEGVSSVIEDAERAIAAKIHSQRVDEVERFFMRTAGVYIGAALMFAAAMQELAGENGSMMELVGMVVLLVSASIAGLGKLGAKGAIACFASSVYSFVLGGWLDSSGGNGSLYTLGGGVIVLISVAALFKMMLTRPKQTLGRGEDRV